MNILRSDVATTGCLRVPFKTVAKNILSSSSVTNPMARINVGNVHLLSFNFQFNGAFMSWLGLGKDHVNKINLFS